MTNMVKTTADVSLIYTKPFWQRLGKKLSNNMRPEEMARVVDVNWEVRGIDSYVNFGGKYIKTGQKSLIRTDTGAILSNVGEDWHIVQNIEIFEFFKELLIMGGMDMDSAGSLKGGQIVWALAKVNEFSFDIFDGDKIETYLLFSNPHQYGMSVNIQFITIRVICSNGLASLKNRSYRIKHIKGFREKSDIVKRDIVKKTLAIARKEFAEYRRMAGILASQPYDKDDLRQYYMEIFPISNPDRLITPDTKLTPRAERCLELVESQPGAKFARGTWWQAFNSVVYVIDHEQNTTAENRLYNQWYGDNKSLKIKAAKKAIQYARAT